MLDFWVKCCYSHHVPQWISQLTVARTKMGPMTWAILTRYRNVFHWQHSSLEKGRSKLENMDVLFISGVALKTTNLRWHRHMPHAKWLIWKKFQGFWWQTVSPWRLNTLEFSTITLDVLNQISWKHPLVSTTGVIFGPQSRQELHSGPTTKMLIPGAKSLHFMVDPMTRGKSGIRW